jgi:hypothetical protein
VLYRFPCFLLAIAIVFLCLFPFWQAAMLVEVLVVLLQVSRENICCTMGATRSLLPR